MSSNPSTAKRKKNPTQQYRQVESKRVEEHASFKQSNQNWLDSHQIRKFQDKENYQRQKGHDKMVRVNPEANSVVNQMEK
jgi:hypothetical protein